MLRLFLQGGKSRQGVLYLFGAELPPQVHDFLEAVEVEGFVVHLVSLDGKAPWEEGRDSCQLKVDRHGSLGEQLLQLVLEGVAVEAFYGRFYLFPNCDSKV